MSRLHRKSLFAKVLGFFLIVMSMAFLGYTVGLMRGSRNANVALLRAHDLSGEADLYSELRMRMTLARLLTDPVDYDKARSILKADLERIIHDVDDLPKDSVLINDRMLEEARELLQRLSR